jgi:type I restriction enzyme R subunit
MAKKPEDKAREDIDRMLEKAGWNVQDIDHINISAQQGIAISDFPLKPGHGFADYILYIDGKAAGVIEAKKAGDTLTGVEIQSDRYKNGLPDILPAWSRPLPFCYQSTGVETRFTNGFEPDCRSRNVFSFHRPETLSEWLDRDTAVSLDMAAEDRAPYGIPPTLYARLRSMPILKEEGLWPAQIKAIQNVEKSLAENRPRALIQMATGSGKTFTAVTAIYRMIKFAKAKRVLFLVDRANRTSDTQGISAVCFSL